MSPFWFKCRLTAVLSSWSCVISYFVVVVVGVVVLHGCVRVVLFVVPCTGWLYTRKPAAGAHPPLGFQSTTWRWPYETITDGNKYIPCGNINRGRGWGRSACLNLKATNRRVKETKITTDDLVEWFYVFCCCYIWVVACFRLHSLLLLQ